MAAATPSTFTIEPFDAAVIPWTRWLKRLEGAFKIFKVSDENKVPYLLHYIGPAAYNVLADRLAAEDPYTKTYNAITKTLQDFYEPKPLEIAENFRLMQRKQLENESIQDYVAALQKLALNCKLGEQMNTMLRNVFVYGLKNKRIQGRMLESEDLTWERAVQIATSMELSEKGTKQFRGEEVSPEVDQISKKTSSTLHKDKSVHSKKPLRGKFQKNYTKYNGDNSNTRSVICFRCGKNHLATVCTMNRNIKCLACGKSGHIKKVCKSAGTNSSTIRTVNSKKFYNSKSQKVDIFAVEHTQYRNKMFVTLNVNSKKVQFEIDSGAAVTLMSKFDAQRLFPKERIQKTNLQLVSYCNKQIKTLGYITVKVRSGKAMRELNLYITTENKTPLLGREWILQLKENYNIRNFMGQLQSLNSINSSHNLQLQSLLNEFQDLTDTSIAKITNIQARLNMKDKVNPVFFKPRAVPFRMRNQVEEEIDRLTQAGILEKVDYSEWATPIVPVIKKDGSIRICGDYSVTLNPNLKVDEHPLPTPDELLASMAGGKVFSKVDLLQAYLQLEVRPEDREFLTLNTHKGLYRPTRLMYGVASAPAIWQRTIENILKDIPGVVVFLDDIRISGSSEKDHLQKLRAVFTRLQKYNIRINIKKSEFFTDSIHYCGYVIDKNGVHKAPDKVEAIQNMRRPENITELRSFLGMIHYYDRFIPNLSTILQPLNQLLQKHSKFIWSSQCERSFQKAKQAFISPRCLVHFDPRLPVTLATDASPYGVGAVLSHVFPDGSERAIQFASKTLSKTQQSYSQIDKEAYAIMFGIKKFYQYLQGARFTLITDHRPLSQIFSPTKNIPVYTAARMQHYALFLQGFNYDIRYRKSEQHANADCLSRLPLPRTVDEFECDSVDVFQFATFDTLPVTPAQVSSATAQDKELFKLLNFLKTGKGAFKGDKFYTVPFSEFTLFNGIIFRGHRVVIPLTLQKKILQELHQGHFGVVKMKLLARSYVWWNKIDNDIEKLASNCQNCNTYKNNPPKISNHIWEPTDSPFERVHADFAGPFLGHYFFILVDAHTKWPEIHIVKNITAETTINLCRQIFAIYGLPQYFVSDNAKTFTSKEFSNFLKLNGVTQRFTAPYHPATNGQAERYVQILKNALKRMQATRANVHVALQNVLLQYRNMPHAATGISPAEAVFSRKVRTRLDIMRPTITKHTSNYESPISFTKGERVSARNYKDKEKWLFGRIAKKLGNLHYEVQLDNGQTWKRHVNQLRRIGEKTPVKDSDYILWDYDTSSTPCSTDASNVTSTANVTLASNVTSTPNVTLTSNATSTSNATLTPNVTPTKSTNVTSSSTPTPNTSDKTICNTSRENTPEAPSFSTFTSPEADTSQFSTPVGSFMASTPKPSPPKESELTPVHSSTRPSRSRTLPLRLQDYIVSME